MAEPAPLLVYVVDDDASIRDSLALMLGLGGYSTRLFADAESLLVAFEAGWSGCVVADLRLPGISGVELQACVRSLGSAIPFVIITAHGDVAVQHNQRAGAKRRIAFDCVQRVQHRGLHRSLRCGQVGWTIDRLETFSP